MNTLTVNKDPQLPRLSSRRPTLERQCSIGTHSSGVDADDFVQNVSTQSTSHPFPSSRSLSTGQSTDDVFGLPVSSSSPAPDTQNNSFPSSNDKSTTAGAMPMSKAGRKRKHPMKPGKYICTYCGRPCAKPSVLEKHIRMHTGERPYPCEVCDLSFKTKSNLYKHRKSSTHKLKCKEKGLSMESLYGESFGSSRDESIDLDGDDDSQPMGIRYNRASSVGGLLDRKSMMSGYAVRQPSYMETLRHLEQVYDAIDDYAKRMGTVVCKHAHWLLDKDCIVSIQLQHPPAAAVSNGSADVDSSRSNLSESAPPSSHSEDVQLRITNLLKANDDIVNNAGRRRLSRQHSVSSPSVQMFTSIAPPNTTSTPPPLPPPTAASSPDVVSVVQQINASNLLESTSKLPDGEELLKHIRQIIQLNTNIDSNIKLSIHKHCMEVKMKLFIPDVAARRKHSEGLPTDSSIDNQANVGQSISVENLFTCKACNQGFAREHILEIHTAFFCCGQLPDNSGSENCSSRSVDESTSVAAAENRKKMKLLKTGSEDSYVYVLADDSYNQNKYSGYPGQPDSSFPPRPPLIQQQSSYEVFQDGVTMKQQLKKHVLKHMSQGSLGTDAVPSSLSGTSSAMLSCDRSIDEESFNKPDSLAPASLSSAPSSAGTLPTSTELFANSGHSINTMHLTQSPSPQIPSVIYEMSAELNTAPTPPSSQISDIYSKTSHHLLHVSPNSSVEPRFISEPQLTSAQISAAAIKMTSFSDASQAGVPSNTVHSTQYLVSTVGNLTTISVNVNGSSVDTRQHPVSPRGKDMLQFKTVEPSTSTVVSHPIFSDKLHTVSTIDIRPATVSPFDSTPPVLGDVDNQYSVVGSSERRSATVQCVNNGLNTISSAASGQPMSSNARGSPLPSSKRSTTDLPPAASHKDGENSINSIKGGTSTVEYMHSTLTTPSSTSNMNMKPLAVGSSNINIKPFTVTKVNSEISLASSTSSIPPTISNMNNGVPKPSSIQSAVTNVNNDVLTTNGLSPSVTNMVSAVSNTRGISPTVKNMVHEAPMALLPRDSNAVHGVGVASSKSSPFSSAAHGVLTVSTTPTAANNAVHGVSTASDAPPASSNVVHGEPMASAMSSKNNSAELRVAMVSSMPPTDNSAELRVAKASSMPPTDNNAVHVTPVTGNTSPKDGNAVRGVPMASSTAPTARTAIHEVLATGDIKPRDSNVISRLGAVSAVGDRPLAVSSSMNAPTSPITNINKRPSNSNIAVNMTEMGTPQNAPSSLYTHHGMDSHRQLNKTVLSPNTMWKNKVPSITLTAPSVAVSQCPSPVPIAPAVVASVNQPLRQSSKSLGKPSNSAEQTPSHQVTEVQRNIQSSIVGTKAPVPARRDAERISSMRRRFSQTRSRSSVSFDEPVVKQPKNLSVPVVPDVARPPRSQISVESVGHQPMQISAAKPLTIHSHTSTHPQHHRTQGLKVSSQCTSNGDTHMCKLNPDLILVNCTVERRPVTCNAVVSGSWSAYSTWEAKKISPGIPWMDVSIPMSCYNHGRRSLSVRYTNSAMDTRSIFTHSSYWQYKNKMRVAQTLTAQTPSTISPTSVALGQSVAVSSFQLAALPTQSSAAVKTEQSWKSFDTCATSRLTLPDREVLNKKKLHRSQSTPNAGDEGQSKLIAGGFKSDEDYVYIRGRGKGKFVCQQCGIRCRKPSMLKKHIRTHTDLRPYSCKHCLFSFKTKGNLTKHMRSKAHHRRCLELHIVPVPLTVGDNQIDIEILASQQKLSRESKIKGAKLTEQERAALEGSEVSEDEHSEEDEDTSDEDSSEDDALHIDESSDDAEKSNMASTACTMSALSIASLRRVQSMPAHHMANSFDASALAEMLPDEPIPTVAAVIPPPKKRKINHLNLTINTSNQLQNKETAQKTSTNIEDDIAMSLLDLSKTPVHGTPTLIKQHSLTKPLLRTGSVKSPMSADVKRVSVVRSTNAAPPNYPLEQDNNEPIDLRVQSKTSKFKYVCPLCRAIFNNQDSLDAHMKLHDGPVIEVPNKTTKRMCKSHSLGNSFDAESGFKSRQQSVSNLLTPSTPNQLRRQRAINMFDSEMDEDVSHVTQVEPGEMLSDEVLKRKCPYCPKVFQSYDSLPQHIKSQHLMTQEYVCTYKDCGNKFTNKQDLTYHLGTHALDDNDKYQPISIPKCGICEKTFKSMNSLKQHLQHHSEARPHVCEYCDAGFTTAQYLKHHLKTHTQERPYVCGECGSTFARSDHLTQHSKIHNKHSSLDIQSRGRPGPTILNPSGAESLHHHP